MLSLPYFYWDKCFGYDYWWRMWQDLGRDFISSSIKAIAVGVGIGVCTGNKGKGLIIGAALFAILITNR